MQTELTNLLPPERKQRLRQDYVYRLATVSMVTIAVLATVNVALLAPTYLYLQGQSDRYTARASALSAARTASGYESLTSRVASLNQNAERILHLADVRAGSDLIRLILDVPRAGITLTSIVVSPGADTTKMTLTGTATTRETLRGFDKALHERKSVVSTDLPLSAYATERDIPFSIAVVLTNTP